MSLNVNTFRQLCYITQLIHSTKLFELPATGSLPPGPPWPGQVDYGNGFSGGTWQLLHADSVLPEYKEESVNKQT